MAAVIFPGSATLSPAEWTQFRLNSANNAVLSGNLETSWNLRTGAPFSSSPTLVGSTLYIGNNGGALYAIDASSGRVTWTYHVKNPIMSAPIVYADSVIIGVGNENSPDGSSPSRPMHVGSGEGALVAVDRRTGGKRWRIELHGSGMPTAAIINGIVVHHDGAGAVIGVDPAAGRKLYARNIQSIASMVAALPVGSDRFVTSGVQANAAWQLRARDGSVVWKSVFSPMASGIGDCPPATDGHRVFCDYIMPPSAATPVITGSSALQRAYALDVATGKKVWDVPIESGILPERNEASIPLVADNAVFIGSSLSPYMHAFDPQTGQLKWRTQVHGPVKGGIVWLDGTIYFGDLAGYLWALDGRTGKVLGDKKMGTAFNVGSPIVAGKTLFIGSLGGTVFAVPLKTIRENHDV
ncbi:MAG: outer membrane protein assembly factor BamB family protein [Vulcanimicrobiaceae bacterium]